MVSHHFQPPFGRMFLGHFFPTTLPNYLMLFGGLGPGGLDIWDPLMNGMLLGNYTDSNPKPPGPKPLIEESQI